MPPNNKKKKKPTSNPARGFATVSTPSRPKAPESQEQQQIASEPTKPQKEAQTPQDQSQNIQKDKSSKTPELQQLSPEELEKHLEDAELQSLVDNYGPKCKNDSSRHVVKLETEQRILRPQAFYLNVSDWLPSELTDEILEKEEIENQNANAKSLVNDADESKLPAMEQDMSVKLWTLQKTLLGLGFPKPKVDEALRNSLLFYSQDSATSKDPVWGLDQALEWLAMHCNTAELPQYDKAQNKIIKKAKIDTTGYQSEYYSILYSP